MLHIKDLDRSSIRHYYQGCVVQSPEGAFRIMEYDSNEKAFKGHSVKNGLWHAEVQPPNKLHLHIPREGYIQAGGGVYLWALRVARSRRKGLNEGNYKVQDWKGTYVSTTPEMLHRIFSPVGKLTYEEGLKLLGGGATGAPLSREVALVRSGKSTVVLLRGMNLGRVLKNGLRLKPEQSNFIQELNEYGIPVEVQNETI